MFFVCEFPCLTASRYVHLVVLLCERTLSRPSLVLAACEMITLSKVSGIKKQIGISLPVLWCATCIMIVLCTGKIPSVLGSKIMYFTE